MYFHDAEPWDYDIKLLVTLCEDCHEYQKETRKEMESLFLKTFYSAGFMHEHLLELTQAFLKYKPFIDHKFPCVAIMALLKDENKMISLLKSIHTPDFIDKEIKKFKHG